MRPNITFTAHGDDPVPTCYTDEWGTHVVDLTPDRRHRIFIDVADPAAYSRQWARQLVALADQIEAAS